MVSKRTAILIYSFLALFLAGSIFIASRSGDDRWAVYENSPAAPLVSDELLRNTYGCLERMETIAGKPQEPYVLLFQSDPEKTSYSLLYYSGGKFTEENMSGVRTIVLAKAGFKTQQYSHSVNGAPMGTITGRSMYVDFYCIDVETGRRYTSGSALSVDRLEAQPFPKKTSGSVDRKYEYGTVEKYVKKHFASWGS